MSGRRPDGLADFIDGLVGGYPLEWAATDAKRQNDDNFAGMRRVGNRDFGGVHMIELPDAFLACQRDGQRRARPAHLLCRRDDFGGVAKGAANRRPETRVDQGSGVFDLAIDTDNGALAV